MLNQWLFVYPMGMRMIKELAPSQLVGTGLEKKFLHENSYG
jgi:hypothetical protein